MICKDVLRIKAEEDWKALMGGGGGEQVRIMVAAAAATKDVSPTCDRYVSKECFKQLQTKQKRNGKQKKQTENKY